MAEEITEEKLKEAVTGLADAFDISDREELASEIESLSLEIPHDVMPEEAWYKLSYKKQRALDLYKQQACIFPEKSSYLSYVYINYNCVEEILSNLMKDLESSVCSSDKSNWLINSYVSYLTTGRELDMTIGEGCYWKPRLGSAKQWVDIVESAILLSNGHWRNYLVRFKDVTELYKENASGNS